MRLTQKQIRARIVDADKYARLLCLHAARDRCEKCGSSFNLEHHHPVAKGMGGALHWSYRLHDLNRICLCRECHAWAESRPLDFARWLAWHRPAQDGFAAMGHPLVYNQHDPTARRDELKAEWEMIEHE